MDASSRFPLLGMMYEKDIQGGKAAVESGKWTARP
jgi:hypothetical protein